MTALAFSMGACKKENNAIIVGKWQETKLRLYRDSAGIIKDDTTYLHPFTNLDYVQFNSNGTCITSTDHYYYINELENPKTPQKIDAVTVNWHYIQAGSEFILTPANSAINPGGFISTDTVSYSNSTLMIHNVSYQGFALNVIVSDAYYTK
jgi:hypothetical protein